MTVLYIKRLITDNKQKISEFIRFGIVGTTAMIMHYGIYFILLPYMHENIAYTIGYFLSFLVNYTLSSYFTFRVKPTIAKFMKFAGSHGINFLVYFGLFNFFLWVGIDKKWAPLPVYAVAVPISFILVRFALTKKLNLHKDKN